MLTHEQIHINKIYFKIIFGSVNWFWAVWAQTCQTGEMNKLHFSFWKLPESGNFPLRFLFHFFPISSWFLSHFFLIYSDIFLISFGFLSHFFLISFRYLLIFSPPISLWFFLDFVLISFWFLSNFPLISLWFLSNFSQISESWQSWRFFGGIKRFLICFFLLFSLLLSFYFCRMLQDFSLWWRWFFFLPASSRY